MANSVYLKKYVENHPNNKMAWYLLGKEYEASGQEGKAHYCYIQAGNVYEAFESSKIPEDLWTGYRAGILRESKRREQRGRFARKVGVALLFALIIIGLPSTHVPGDTNPGNPAFDQNAEVYPSPDAEPPKRTDNGRTESLPPVKGPVFTARKYVSGVSEPAETLGGLLQKNGPALNTAVLGMKPSGKWLIWLDKMPLAYGIERSPEDGRTTIQSYDPAACRCKIPDVAGLQKDAKKWISRQESLGVLYSAMKHYKEQKGKWPSSLRDLTSAYPGNWLAGEDTVMKRAFAPMLQEMQGGGGQDNPDGEASSGTAGGFRPGEEPFFSKPFEVIVDTQAHRLAVVSGNVMLRSYPVGLGGKKTPEGTFHISEKVINPNGRDNGEFGSRGMQLSDTNYAIHGTNKPESIGKDESLGCIRMNKKDLEELFDLVPKRTKVSIGKGILTSLESVPKQRFALGHRQDQRNPQRTYHWLD